VGRERHISIASTRAAASPPEAAEARRTLAGRVLAPRSRRGSLNLLLPPSIFILSETRVSGLVAEFAAMVAGDAGDVVMAMKAAGPGRR
jgi:hypothetical protein